MYKIGVIGDRESVLGFKAVGLEVFPCDRSEEAEEVLEKMAKEQFAKVLRKEGLI